MSEPFHPEPDVKVTEFEATPFISPKNVPFWAAVTVALIVVGMVLWLGA
ncbi:MAG: hypothetical protein ABW360_10035 [Phenylobacterium sp.]